MDIDDALDVTGDEWKQHGPSTAIIILAAGASTRMGSPKLLLRYGSGSLLRYTAEVAAASVCRPILVVLGDHSNQLIPEIHHLPVRPVINERWSEGLGSSIQVGVRVLNTYIGTEAPQALVLMLCDQPFVTAAVIHDLVTAYHSSDKGIVASEYAGILGVPALFTRKYFADLAGLSGTAGAKQIIARHASDVRAVPFPQGATDIDTPEDYRQLRRVMLPQLL